MTLFGLLEAFARIYTLGLSTQQSTSQFTGKHVRLVTASSILPKQMLCFFDNSRLFLACVWFVLLMRSTSARSFPKHVRHEGMLRVRRKPDGRLKLRNLTAFHVKEAINNSKACWFPWAYFFCSDHELWSSQKVWLLCLTQEVNWIGFPLIPHGLSVAMFFCYPHMLIFFLILFFCFFPPPLFPGVFPGVFPFSPFFRVFFPFLSTFTGSPLASPASPVGDPQLRGGGPGATGQGLRAVSPPSQASLCEWSPEEIRGGRPIHPDLASPSDVLKMVGQYPKLNF